MNIMTAQELMSYEANHIMQFFTYGHLPAKLQAVSKPFRDLAERVFDTLPANPERSVALRKLLEAKDAAIRAQVAQTGGSNGSV